MSEAQQIDLLENRLNGVNDTLSKAQIHLEIAKELQQQDPQKSLHHAEAALQLAEALRDQKLQGKSLQQIGIAHIIISNVSESLDAFKKSLAIFEELGDKQYQSYLLDNIGSVYGAMSQHDLALETIFKSLGIAEEIHDKKAIAKICNNISVIYKQMGDFPRAVEYQTRSLSVRENDPENQPNDVFFINVGNLHLDLEEFDKAIEYYKKALFAADDQNSQRGRALALGNLGSAFARIQDFKNAEKCLKEAIQMHGTMHDRISHSRDLMNLGEMYRKSGRYDEALDNLQKALKINIEADRRRAGIIQLCLGELYIEMDQTAQASGHLQSALDIFEMLGLQEYLFKIHHAFSSLYEKTGDFKKALDYFKKYTAIRMELQNAEKKQLSSELQARFILEKTEREKELLKIQNQELSDVLQQLESANIQLRDADDEKNDLLGIIAHDLKNPLSGIRMMARFLKESPKTSEEVIEIGQDIEDSTNRMFDLISNLLKANQIESGRFQMQIEELDIRELLLNSVGRFAMQAAEKNIDFTTEIPKDLKPVKADRNALDQILDNIISNAVKYSPHGKNVNVRITQLPGSIRVRIQDEGPGLTDNDKIRLFQKFARLSAQPTGGEHSNGLGLYIAKKLTEALNGCIYCESEPGHGAAFIIELPSVAETVEV